LGFGKVREDFEKGELFKGIGAYFPKYPEIFYPQSFLERGGKNAGCNFPHGRPGGVDHLLRARGALFSKGV